MNRELGKVQKLRDYPIMISPNTVQSLRPELVFDTAHVYVIDILKEAKGQEHVSSGQSREEDPDQPKSYRE